MDRNYNVIAFQNIFILRSPRVVIFADIIKIVTMCIKKIIKDSKKVKRIKNCAFEIQSIYEFLDIAKLTDFR